MSFCLLVFITRNCYTLLKSCSTIFPKNLSLKVETGFYNVSINMKSTVLVTIDKFAASVAFVFIC